MVIYPKDINMCKTHIQFVHEPSQTERTFARAWLIYKPNRADRLVYIRSGNRARNVRAHIFLSERRAASVFGQP